ncbi:MAG TPA: RsmE family RNA methyltransferase [Exilispira sp.]|nr:RsmE family RNA methyltransferase [Exilispira sp.]
MRLIFLEKKNIKEGLYFLSFEDSKHVFANRYKINDRIKAVMDDKIGEFIIKKINNKIVFGSFIPTSSLSLSKYNLNLIIGLPKDRALNPIIEKSSEIGVNMILIIPLEFSDRKSISEKNINRLNRIAKEACMQSGNPYLPKIVNLLKIEELLSIKELSDGYKIFLDEKSEVKLDFFDIIKNNPIEKFKNLNIFVGPEGGISDNERSFLIKIGFQPISLGENILRTETAAISSAFFFKLFQKNVFKF